MIKGDETVSTELNVSFVRNYLDIDIGKKEENWIDESKGSHALPMRINIWRSMSYAWVILE